MHFCCAGGSLDVLWIVIFRRVTRQRHQQPKFFNHGHHTRVAVAQNTCIARYDKDRVDACASEYDNACVNE